MRPFLFLPLLLAAPWLRGQSERPPNIVVVVGDDHASTVYGAYGNDRVRTPHLDSLAAAGVRFTRAHAQSPLCSASRQSILTGKYPHATGVNLLFTPFNDATNLTLAEVLSSAGYATALVGKQHFNSWIWSGLFVDGPPTYGFDTLIDNREYRTWLSNSEQRAAPRGEVYADSIPNVPREVASLNPEVLPQAYDSAHAKASFLTGAALGFADRQGERPFLLWVAYNEPHAPFAFPTEYAGRHRASDMRLPEGSPEDDRWVPDRYRDLSDEQRRGAIASYYTSVEWLDANVGRLLRGLRSRGQLDNTLVVYLGDQGYLLYDHKRFEKHSMWREAVQAPLVFAGGGVLAGAVRDDVVELVDVLPTVCEAVGIAVPGEVQGRSLWPSIIDDDSTAQARAAFAEFLEDNSAMLCTGSWKYVFTTGKRDLGQGYATGLGAAGITHRLYDLEADPRESTNVAGDNPEVLARLQSQLLERFRKTHPDAADVPEGMTTVGQLVWFCEPRDVGAEYGGEPLRVVD